MPSSSRSTTRRGSSRSPTRSTAAGCPSSWRCPISTPTRTRSPSSTSSSRTRAGSGTSRRSRPPSRPSPTRPDIMRALSTVGAGPPRPLAAGDILRGWELGQDRHPVDRALCLLRLACPDTPWQALAALPVGRRDALLYALREQTFGRRMNGRAACPACATQAELALDTATLVVPVPDEVVDEFEEDGVSLRFRLPDSLDPGGA